MILVVGIILITTVVLEQVIMTMKALVMVTMVKVMMTMVKVMMTMMTMMMLQMARGEGSGADEFLCAAADKSCLERSPHNHKKYKHQQSYHF